VDYFMFYSIAHDHRPSGLIAAGTRPIIVGAGPIARSPSFMITATRWSNIFLARALRRLSRSERGSMSIMIAFGLTVLLGFAALGVGVLLWLRARSNAQSAADAAANSAGAAAYQVNSTARIKADVNAMAAANGFQNGMNGVTVTMNNPPASGAYAGNASAYEVIVTAPQKANLAKRKTGT